MGHDPRSPLAWAYCAASSKGRSKGRSPSTFEVPPPTPAAPRSWTDAHAINKMGKSGAIIKTILRISPCCVRGSGCSQALVFPNKVPSAPHMGAIARGKGGLCVSLPPSLIIITIIVISRRRRRAGAKSGARRRRRAGPRWPRPRLPPTTVSIRVSFLTRISVVSSPFRTIDRSNDSRGRWLFITLSIVFTRHRLEQPILNTNIILYRYCRQASGASRGRQAAAGASWCTWPWRALWPRRSKSSTAKVEYAAEPSTRALAQPPPPAFILFLNEQFM